MFSYKYEKSNTRFSNVSLAKRSTFGHGSGHTLFLIKVLPFKANARWRGGGPFPPPQPSPRPFRTPFPSLLLTIITPFPFSHLPPPLCTGSPRPPLPCFSSPRHSSSSLARRLCSLSHSPSLSGPPALCPNHRSTDPASLISRPPSLGRCLFVPGQEGAG